MLYLHSDLFHSIKLENCRGGLQIILFDNINVQYNTYLLTNCVQTLGTECVYLLLVQCTAVLQKARNAGLFCSRAMGMSFQVQKKRTTLLNPIFLSFLYGSRAMGMSSPGSAKPSGWSSVCTLPYPAATYTLLYTPDVYRSTRSSGAVSFTCTIVYVLMYNRRGVILVHNTAYRIKQKVIESYIKMRQLNLYQFKYI